MSAKDICKELAMRLTAIRLPYTSCAVSCTSGRPDTPRRTARAQTSERSESRIGVRNGVTVDPNQTNDTGTFAGGACRQAQRRPCVEP